MHSLSIDGYHRLLDVVYQAAIEPSEWVRFLATLSDETGGGLWIGLHCHDSKANRNLGILNHGYDPDFIGSYRSEYSSINPWTQSVVSGPVGLVQTSESIVDAEELVRSRFYNEWLRPQEDLRTGVGVTLCQNSDRLIRLSCNIRHRDRDRLPNLVQTIELLVPHLQRALAMACDLGGSAVNGNVANVMENLPGAIWVLNNRAGVCFANAKAELLRTTQGIWAYDRAGSIVFNDPTADRALRKALFAISEQRGRHLKPIAINLEQRSIIATVFPFKTKSDADIGIGHWLNDNWPAAVLYIPDSTATIAEMASKKFGLTPAEVRLSRSLCAGNSLTDYASDRGISVQTVRKQLKTIFSKTGVHQQSKLVALLTNELSI